MYTDKQTKKALDFFYAALQDAQTLTPDEDSCEIIEHLLTPQPTPKQDEWDMDTFILTRKRPKGLFTEKDTVICGRWQLEKYMRQGYYPDWVATDNARNSNSPTPPKTGE